MLKVTNFLFKKYETWLFSLKFLKSQNIIQKQVETLELFSANWLFTLNASTSGQFQCPVCDD